MEHSWNKSWSTVESSGARAKKSITFTPWQKGADDSEYLNDCWLLINI